MYGLPLILCENTICDRMLAHLINLNYNHEGDYNLIIYNATLPNPIHERVRLINYKYIYKLIYILYIYIDLHINIYIYRPYHYNLVANIVISRWSFSRQTTQTDLMYSTCPINIVRVISHQSRGRLETTLTCAPQRLRIKLRHYYRRPLSTGGLFRFASPFVSH